MGKKKVSKSSGTFQSNPEMCSFSRSSDYSGDSFFKRARGNNDDVMNAEPSSSSGSNVPSQPIVALSGAGARFPYPVYHK